MKKMLLSVDDLRVESFVTVDRLDADRGTVHGHAQPNTRKNCGDPGSAFCASIDEPCETWISCPVTVCYYSCGVEGGCPLEPVTSGC